MSQLLFLSNPFLILWLSQRAQQWNILKDKELQDGGCAQFMWENITKNGPFHMETNKDVQSVIFVSYLWLKLMSSSHICIPEVLSDCCHDT